MKELSFPAAQFIAKEDPEHVLIIAVHPDGSIAMNSETLTIAQSNYYLDRAKKMLLED